MAPAADVAAKVVAGLLQFLVLGACTYLWKRGTRWRWLSGLVFAVSIAVCGSVILGYGPWGAVSALWPLLQAGGTHVLAFISQPVAAWKAVICTLASIALLYLPKALGKAAAKAPAADPLVRAWGDLTRLQRHLLVRIWRHADSRLDPDPYEFGGAGPFKAITNALGQKGLIHTVHSYYVLTTDGENLVRHIYEELQREGRDFP